MLKKSLKKIYVVTAYGDGCMTCCTTNSATGTSSSAKPSASC